MKKILIGLLAISSVAMASKGQSSIGVRAGAEIGGRFTKTEGFDVLSKDTNVSTNSDFGGEFALEYYYEVAQDLELGVGVGYQRHMARAENLVSITDSTNTKRDAVATGGEFSSLPVYATAKINIPIEGQIRPYLKANLGYSFNSRAKDIKVEDKENGNDIESVKLGVTDGLYVAGGLGVDFYDTIDVDLMMALTKAQVYARGERREEFRNDYIRGVLSIGYKFNWN